MFSQKMFYLFFTCLLLGFLSSCNPDDDANNDPDPNPEYIQRLTMSLTPSTGGQPFTISYFDEDGPGGTAPILSAEQLPIQTTFEVSTQIFDENGQLVNYNNEKTQIFYAVSGLDMDITYDDMDNNMNPIGLKLVISTGEFPSSGTLDIVLKTDVSKPNTGLAASTTGDTKLATKVTVSTF